MAYYDPNRSRLNRYANQALEEEGGRSSELGGLTGESRNRYVSSLSGFDPRQYAGAAAGAFATDALEDLESQDARSRSFANRTGVLHGASRQANALDFRKRVGRGLAGLGMQAGGLELSRIGQEGDVYGMDIGREEAGRNRYLDFLSGERDRSTAEENARRMAEAQEASRPKWWEQVLSAGARVGGAWLGGR